MRTKTRLWSGGIADIVRQAKDRLPDSDFVREAPPLALSPAAGDDAGEDSQVADLATTTVLPPRPRPPASGGSTLVGHAFDLSGVRDGAAWAPGAVKNHEMRATRLVPIESLLPKPSEPPTRAPEPALAGPPSPADVGLAPPRRLGDLLRARPTGTQLRRGLMVVLALAAAVLFALPKLRTATARSPSAPSAPVAEAAPTAPVGAEARPHEHAFAADPLPTEALVTPRQAVDALASGDYLKAQRAYAQLARQTNDVVYAEAARILSERTARTH